MAKKSIIAKSERKPKFGVRAYTRGQRCGGPHSVYDKTGLGFVCLREMAHRGEVPRVTKTSW
ncbi:30S ribosomal protein S14 [Streptomyces rubellomurinus subsp. indigoferus]|nr:30S ribosomal protein S14 [Streptomyces rubellomurinus subsp. indigoferus]